MNRIKDLQDFIGSQQSEITESDESFVRKLIQQITVYDDRFTVRFKSGLEIDINEYEQTCSWELLPERPALFGLKFRFIFLFYFFQSTKELA